MEFPVLLLFIIILLDYLLQLTDIIINYDDTIDEHDKKILSPFRKNSCSEFNVRNIHKMSS